MNDSAKGKYVLIIDRQPFWQDKAVAALEKKGYLVSALGTYDYASETSYFKGIPPDLVIIGCSSIKHEERELINKVLADHRHLVVLCASLPWGDMRALFLAGADDVVDNKPYDSDRFVSIVEEAFEGMKK